MLIAALVIQGLIQFDGEYRKWIELEEIASIPSVPVHMESEKSVCKVDVQYTDKGWLLSADGQNVLYAPGFTEKGITPSLEEAGQQKSTIGHRLGFGPFTKPGIYYAAFIRVRYVYGAVVSGRRFELGSAEPIVSIGMLPTQSGEMTGPYHIVDPAPF